MNSDDTLYGRIKNGVLTLSGNSPSVRVDGGSIVVSDGPVPVAANHRGPALPVKERMVTCSFHRAGCPLNRIVVTRPDGFVTFGAIKWLNGVGASLVQLDWDGTVLIATAPAGTDRPALRRAQALAAGTEIGRSITRQILYKKLDGQAAVARTLGRIETAELIVGLAGELNNAPDDVRLRGIEAVAAGAYWPLWAGTVLRFARRHNAPAHWRTFGGRHSHGGAALKAVSPGNAILNYLYAVAVGEMTIALTSAGLDPGIGIFYADKDRRPSLAYDAIEALRPYVDAWLAEWLTTACFSKRDFYEETDGTIRLTRPLTSHLAMTAAIWRAPAQAIASWLVRALAGPDREPRLGSPFPALPAPKRTWQGLEPPVAKTCHECGKALGPRRLKFCSEECSIAFHVATTTVGELTAPAAQQESGAEKVRTTDGFSGSGSAKHRRNLALRRAWDAHHQATPVGPKRERNSFTLAGGSAVDRLREWYGNAVKPLVAKCRLADVRVATGLSKRYAIMIRQGHVPHPRHYPNLASLVGVELPNRRGV